MSIVKLAYFKDKEGHHGHGAMIGAGVGGATIGAGLYKYRNAAKDMLDAYGTTKWRGRRMKALAVGLGAAAGAGLGSGIGALIRTNKRENS
jgi:hypothetical protein